MIIPENWNDIIKVSSEKKANLPLGGHICKIVGISKHTSTSGNSSFRITFDIDDDSEYKGCFQKMYDEAKAYEYRMWPNEGTRYLSLKEKNLPYLKEFIEAVENSNHLKLDVQVGKDLDLNQFEGLLVAGQFGLEEYIDKDGEVKTTVSLFRFKNIDELNNIKIPRVKLLNGSYQYYEEYLKNKTN